MKENLKKIYRIFDVNLNRSKEGLRVIEEYIRFYLEDKELYLEIRDIRHNLSKICESFYYKILFERNIKTDNGRDILEPKRKNFESILISNFKRVEESLRVLEEFSKFSEDFEKLKKDFKKFRFLVYYLEYNILYKYILIKI